MELGNKIKQLRYKAGLTQEQLASKLGISAQSVSKWENSVSMPDITLLPLLAEEFGVSIDELFDITAEQKLRRIENCLEVKEEIPPDVFRDYEDFLKTQLLENNDNPQIFSLLANLYHHRMESDARKVSKYARTAIKLQPEHKDCQWLLNMSEGAYVWDWNMYEHSSLINFYKEIIRKDNIQPPTPLPYYYLIDHLIADHRTKEAEEYLQIYQTLPAHKPFMVSIYQAHIALADFNAQKADHYIEEAIKKYSNESGFLFEVAQYYARKCDYAKAIDFYEQSWKMGETSKPRFTDALHGIAKIYGIMGNKEKLAQTYDRILDSLQIEWGLSDDDKVVVETKREKDKFCN